MWSDPEPDEGRWEPVRHGFLKGLRVTGAKDPAPPYFYRTYVRSDPKRPYSKVLLVAMDARQLELGMEGGIEDPKSLTGAHGDGRIPRDPDILSRAVGAFNGAFKTTHGQYGMMVHRRVLLPARAGAATVLVTREGRAGFGSWPSSEAIPDDIVSFRQNLEPLVEDLKLNPSGRVQWGFQLPGTSMLTHRSGLCLTSTGHMVYAWGGEVSAPTLGNALIQAGCVYGLHLDMNPHHTAFAFLDIRDPARRDFDAKLLTPEMEVLPERFILWSPKDFFYLTLRRLGPRVAESVELEPEATTQPPPSWAPAVFKATISTESGARVRLIGFAPGRVRFAVSDPAPAGGAKASEPDTPAREASDSERALAAIALGSEPKGAASWTRIRGAVRGRYGGEAVVGVGPRGELRVAIPTSAEAPELPGDVLEVPVLRAGGTLRASASLRTSMRKRAALCVAADGFTWVAQTTASQDEGLARALERVGCDLVVSLDRGGQSEPCVHVAGSPTPPLERYEVPSLAVLGRPMRPGAFRWPQAEAADEPEPAHGAR
jgi:hypothetical protein